MMLTSGMDLSTDQFGIRISGSGDGWPLAGIPFAAALQATDLKPQDARNTLTVVGAGTAIFNTVYMQTKPSDNIWINGDGTLSFQFNIQAPDTWGLFQSGTCFYVGTNSTAPGGLPGDTPYTTTGAGSNPPPDSVTPNPTPFARTLGLFQDAGQTVPCVNWGDLCYTWADVLSGSGVVATQSVSTQRPALRYAPNASGVWVPYLWFDGVDDSMVIPSLTAPEAFCAVKSDAPTATYQVGMSALDLGNPFLYLLDTANILNNSSAWFSEFRVNGVLGYPPGVFTGWNIITGNTPTVAGSTRVELGNYTGAYPLNGGVSAALIPSSSLSSMDRTKVEAYLATLLPT